MFLLQVQESDGNFRNYDLPCCNASFNNAFMSSNGVFYITVPSLILQNGNLRYFSYAFHRVAGESVCNGEAFKKNIFAVSTHTNFLLTFCYLSMYRTVAAKRNQL
jgi:hypothetical protein